MKRGILIITLIITTLVIAGCTTQLKKIRESPPVGEGESEGEGPGRYYKDETLLCNIDSNCEDMYIRTLYLNQQIFIDGWFIKLVEIEGSTKVKINIGMPSDYYGIYWFNVPLITSLNEVGLKELYPESLIIQPIEINPAFGSTIVKIVTKNLALDGQIMHLDEPLDISGNTVELKRINIDRSGYYIGAISDDLRTLYGTIIKDTLTYGSMDEVILKIPQEQIKANLRLSSSSQEPYEKEQPEIAGAVTAFRNLITGASVGLNDLRVQIPLGNPLQSEQGFPQVVTPSDIDGLQDTTIIFNGGNYDIHDEIAFLNNYTNVETDLSYFVGYEDFDLDIFIPPPDAFSDLAYYYRFDTPIVLSEVSEDNPLNINFLGQEISIVDIGEVDISLLNPDSGEILKYYNGDPYFEQSSTALLIIEDNEYLMEARDHVKVDDKTVTLENIYSSSVSVEVSEEKFEATLIIDNEEYLMEMGDSITIDDYTVTLVNVGGSSAFICVSDELTEDCDIISVGSSRNLLGLEIFLEDVNYIYIAESGVIPEGESDIINELEIFVEEVNALNDFVSDWSWHLSDLYEEHPVIGITSPISKEEEEMIVEECKNFPNIFSLCFERITPDDYNTYSVKYNNCRDLINNCEKTFDLTSDLNNGYTLLANGIDGLNSDKVVDEVYLKYNNYNVEVYYKLPDIPDVIYAGTTNLNEFAKKTNDDNIKFSIPTIIHNREALLSVTTVTQELDENIIIHLGISNNNFKGLGNNSQIGETGELEWSEYIGPNYLSAIININDLGYTFYPEGNTKLIDNLLIKVDEISEEQEIVFAGMEAVNQYACGQNEVITKDISYSCSNYQCFSDLNTFKTVDSCEAPEYCIDGVACCTKEPEEFFPIMIFHTGNETSSLQTMKDIGFNSFTSPDLGLSSLNTLKEAENRNLKYFLIWSRAQHYADYGLTDQETMESEILNDVNQYCSYDSLSRYYLNDEPYADEVDEMATVTSILNNFDPEHPGIAAYDRNYDLLVYNIHPNELLTDFYPITKGTLENDTSGVFTRLTTALSIARETALNEGIPLWFIAQAFGSKDPQTLDVHNWREPAPAELREQVYLALAYSAKGISYWRYSTGLSDNPQYLFEGLVEDDYVTPRPLFYTVQAINNELNQLAPTLLSLNSLAVCNSRTLNLESETLSICSNCSYGAWYFESGIELIEQKGKSTTFILEKSVEDDPWFVFSQYQSVNSTESPYIKIDYEILENNGTSLIFEPGRRKDRYTAGYLHGIPMPSSVGEHSYYAYIDDLRGRGTCMTYRNCVDCISPSCEENVSISIFLGDVVDFNLEEGETIEVSGYSITVTDIRWNSSKIKVENGIQEEREVMFGETRNIGGLDIRLDEINRVTSRSDSECTERCEYDDFNLRFVLKAREPGNSIKLKINDITTASCSLPFITEATQDVEIGNFEDNNNKKYIMVVNRDPQSPITTTLTFSSAITEGGLTDMLTGENFPIIQQQASIQLTPGHGRLLKLGPAS